MTVHYTQCCTPEPSSGPAKVSTQSTCLGEGGCGLLTTVEIVDKEEEGKEGKKRPDF